MTNGESRNLYLNQKQISQFEVMTYSLGDERLISLSKKLFKVLLYFTTQKGEHAL